MKKIALIAFCALTLPGLSLGADMMREGYWELTTTTDIPGMPVKIPPTRMKHCYTREDVRDNKKMVSTDPNCSVTEMKQSGNKISWKMKCTGEKAGTFSGETVYKTDAYDSTMKMQSEGQTVNMKVKGKRVGNCP